MSDLPPEATRRSRLGGEARRMTTDDERAAFDRDARELGEELSRDPDEGRERVLLLIAEAKRLRALVRGLAALDPLAALEGGVLLCWTCGVNTPVETACYRDGVGLTAEEVVVHRHHDDQEAAHLPTCVWLLAATYPPALSWNADEM